MGYQLEGKVVLITGGASGIGKGIAERFIKEGAIPLLIDINESELKKTANAMYDAGVPSNQLGILSGDIREINFHEEIISYTVERFGAIDVLINCAGIFPSKPALAITESEWDSVFDINVKSLFFLTQKIVNHMVDHKTEGNVINITSLASEVARPGIAHYGASKAAVKMLTQVLAIEFAPLGIRVNALAPGVVETETLLDTLHSEEANKEHQEKISNYPMGRAVKVSEVADGVLFLAGNQSTSITGQNILVDGGYSAGRVFRSFPTYH